jgi:tetratricopeptide (TPR) repeat protein
MKEDIMYRTAELLSLVGQFAESVEIMERLFTQSKHYSKDAGALYNHARNLCNLLRHQDTLDYLNKSEKAYEKSGNFPELMKQSIFSLKSRAHEGLG